MKYYTFILIILLSGCASQNNQTTQNLPTYHPEAQMPAKTTPASSQPEPTTEETPQGSQEAPEQTASVKESPAKEAITKTPTPAPAKPALKKKEDVYKNNYICDFEKIYKVYAAESTDNAEGQLKVNINKDIVTIEIIAAQVHGTYQLKLRSSTGMSMIATNKSMVFQYTFYPQKFTFNTGIAASGFDLARGGHQGNQMRISGKCH
jgi:hypothetical protein